MKLVIIIPAYNEEKHIVNTLNKIPSEIEGIEDIQVIVIDDGSTDSTARVALDSGKAEVISYKKNRGVGYAFRKGINAALKAGANIIVNLDADGQFDPKDIEKLIKPILNGNADMVTGSRFIIKQKTPNFSFTKRVGNKIFTKAVNFLTGEKFTDTQCGFRAYSREAALKLNLFGDFTYTQEVFLDLMYKGMRIEEIPVSVVYKENRKSRVVKNPFNYGIKALLIMLRTIRDMYPLKFFGIIGSIIFSSGFVMGAFLLIRWALIRRVSPYTSMVQLSAVLLIVGFLCIVLALIADMLGRQKRIQEEILYYNKLKTFEKKRGENFEK